MAASEHELEPDLVRLQIADILSCQANTQQLSRNVFSFNQTLLRMYVLFGVEFTLNRTPLGIVINLVISGPQSRTKSVAPSQYKQVMHLQKGSLL